MIAIDTQSSTVSGVRGYGWSLALPLGGILRGWTAGARANAVAAAERAKARIRYLDGGGEPGMPARYGSRPVATRRGRKRAARSRGAA